MNKKSILLILLSTLALGANAQGKYTIKSNLQNAEGQKIYLYSGDMGNMDIDSTIIANGKFTLKGELDTPGEDGLYPVLMAAAATKSLKEGRPVKISEVE